MPSCHWLLEKLRNSNQWGRNTWLSIQWNCAISQFVKKTKTTHFLCEQKCLLTSYLKYMFMMCNTLAQEIMNLPSSTFLRSNSISGLCLRLLQVMIFEYLFEFNYNSYVYLLLLLRSIDQLQGILSLRIDLVCVLLCWRLLDFQKYGKFHSILDLLLKSNTNGTGPPFLELKLFMLEALLFKRSLDLEMLVFISLDFEIIDGDGEFLLIFETKDC